MGLSTLKKTSIFVALLGQGLTRLSLNAIVARSAAAEVEDYLHSRVDNPK